MAGSAKKWLVPFLMILTALLWSIIIGVPVTLWAQRVIRR